MEIIFLIAGLAIGALIGILLSRSKTHVISVKLEEKSQALEKANLELGSGRAEILELNKLLSKTETENANISNRLDEQKKELEELNSKFKTEFENIANRILEDKSRKFTDQNRENLDAILSPLKERIRDFEKRVNDVYIEDTKERAALIEQLKNLQDLNIQMSEDANNLTKALKGDSQAQGAWGEYILESILEKSGLERGREFLIQETFKTEDGLKLRPDVIIMLPEDKSLIIDSKLSLNAYEAYCSAESIEDKNYHLREHLSSIRRHIKGLSAKDYQNLYGIQSLDFVLMFLPIEPAFSLAVQNEQSLFYDAFAKNIILVSPSTLLATLRTISSIWKQEKQNRNALDIARKSGELYDKLTAFVDDLIQVGRKMEDAKKAYSSAMNKLSEGKGNIVGRAEDLKKMGAKTSTTIDKRIVSRADNNNENENDDDQLTLILKS